MSQSYGSVTHTLLLADDSVTVQRVVALMFADGPIRVVTAGHGQQAIERMLADRPDIVLADVAMPRMDGFEVARWVRNHPEFSTVPVLLLAGTFEPVDEQRLHESGANGVLEKPFEPSLVISRVKELLGLKSSTSPSSDVAVPSLADVVGAAEQELVSVGGGHVRTRPPDNLPVIDLPPGASAAQAPVGATTLAQLDDVVAALDAHPPSAPVAGLFGDVDMTPVAQAHDVFAAFDAHPPRAAAAAPFGSVALSGADEPTPTIAAPGERAGAMAPNEATEGVQASEATGDMAHERVVHHVSEMAAQAGHDETESVGVTQASPEQLHEAFAWTAPVFEPAAAPQAGAGVASLFSSLLAAEQRGEEPRVVLQTAAPEMSDAVLDAIATRVVQRLQPDVIGDALRTSLTASLQETVASTVQDSVSSAVRESVGASVHASVESSVSAAMQTHLGGTVADAIRAAVGPAVEAAVRDAVAVAVREAARDAVGRAVDAAVREAVAAAVRESVAMAVPQALQDGLQSAIVASVRDAAREAVRDVVSETSERLVSDEIARIRSVGTA